MSDQPAIIPIPKPVSQIIADTLLQFKGGSAELAEAIERAILKVYNIEAR